MQLNPLKYPSSKRTLSAKQCVSDVVGMRSISTFRLFELFILCDVIHVSLVRPQGKFELIPLRNERVNIETPA